MRITFEAAELPEDHPEKHNDRSATIAKRWWNVTVVDDEGVEHHATAQWRGPHDLHREIHEATRGERPSETVMRLMQEKREASRAAD